MKMAGPSSQATLWRRPPARLLAPSWETDPGRDQYHDIAGYATPGAMRRASISEIEVDDRTGEVLLTSQRAQKLSLDCEINRARDSPRWFANDRMDGELALVDRAGGESDG